MDACSPVPAYTVVGEEGAKAMDPIAKEAFWSPTAAQLAPASVVRQIPPCAPPIRTVLPVESDGSAATAVMRPVAGLKKPPVVGVGPMELQVFVTTVASGAAAYCGATSANVPSGRSTSLPSATIIRCMCSKARSRAPAGMWPLADARGL